MAITTIGTNKPNTYLQITLATIEDEATMQSIGREIELIVVAPSMFNILKNP